MTSRTGKSVLLNRRIGAVAAAMGFISFALGYLVHPM